MWNFIKSLSVNLHASGPALVVIVWMVCVTVLGIYGEGPIARSAMNLFAIGGGVILFSLVTRIKPG